MRLKDSGNRILFKTGSNKDSYEGKGRYDLLPLYIIKEFLTPDNKAITTVLEHIHNAMISVEVTNKIAELKLAVDVFMEEVLQTTMEKKIHMLAKLFEAGAIKYSERDWEKGRPMEVYVDSSLRHLFQYLNGEVDEDHATAFMWNLISCMDTMRRMPSLAYTIPLNIDKEE